MLDLIIRNGMVIDGSGAPRGTATASWMNKPVALVTSIAVGIAIGVCIGLLIGAANDKVRKR